MNNKPNKFIGQILCFDSDYGVRVLLKDLNKSNYSYFYYLPKKYFKELAESDFFHLTESKNKFKVRKINKQLANNLP